MLYTNNEQSKKDIKETISFTIALNRIKYLGMNFTKEMKDLYSENYKLLLKEIKKTPISGLLVHVHGLEHEDVNTTPKQSTESM